MSQAKSGDSIKVHYTGKLADGTVFDTSVGGEPLGFTIGAGEIIPGFDQAVVGMSEGDKKTINIPADQAYGPSRDDMVVVIERSQISPDAMPQVGQHLQLRQPDGSPLVVLIKEVGDTTITLDANHPLAGKALVFDIELLEIA